MKRRVELQIYEERGEFGLTISRMIGGDGEGYRIFGPKMYGDGIDVKTVVIDESEINRLIEELEDSKKFLKGPTDEQG